ncbi:MAG: DUF4266 domain-containing protein [Bacteroidetes bacterium]|nr:DUF4266 domain-containing protein [Bacteroidota bacterium]
MAMLAMAMQACVQVKEYQKMYVNDRDMDVTNKTSEQFETNMEVFREGAAGANGGKSGGGCACN